MLNKLYSNIGTKIQNLAKWIFIVEAIGAIITGFVSLVDWGFEDGWWALFIIILGPIVALVSSWLLYGFGEFVEDIHAIRHQTVTVNNIDKNLQTIAQPEKDTATKKTHQAKEKDNCPAKTIAKNEASTLPVKTENSLKAEYWICGNCKTKNLNTRNDCWSCGQRK